MGKNRKCFAPGCNSGYLTCKRKYSLFQAPSTEARDKWQSIIPRQDRLFSLRDVLCEKHFQRSDIVRQVQINNVMYPYKKPKLKIDAVPKFFPNCSKHLSKRRAHKKTTNLERFTAISFSPVTSIEIALNEKSDTTTTGAVASSNHEESCLVTTQEEISSTEETTKPASIEDDEDMSEIETQEIFIDTFEEIIYKKRSLKLPEGWTVHTQQEKVVIAQCQLCRQSNNARLSKQIIIDRNLTYDLFFYDNPVEKSLIVDLHNLEIIKFGDVDKLIDVLVRSEFCVGGPKVRAFPQSEVKSRVAHADSSGRWRHEMCTITAQSRSPCVYCSSLHNTFSLHRANSVIKAKILRCNHRKLYRHRKENIKLKLQIKELKHKLDALNN